MTQSTAIIKTFTCKASDPFDDYPAAIIAIDGWYEKTGRGAEANPATNKYDLSEKKDGLTYSASIWNSQKAKNDGKISRELLTEKDDGTYTTVFSVDLDHAESEQVMASSMGQDDKILLLIQKDLIRRNR